MKDGEKTAGRHRVETTARGKTLALTGCCWILIGMIASAPIVSLLGSAIGIFVAVSFLNCLVDQRRYSSPLRGAIKLAPEPITGNSVIRGIVGSTISLPIAISLSESRPLRIVQITAVANSTLAVTDTSWDRKSVRLGLNPRRIGDTFLQGLFIEGHSTYGLFRFSFFSPCRVRLQALPRTFTGSRGVDSRTAGVAARTHATSKVARKKGLGLELRELRDYQSGDSFKHIAWRATARRGKLMAREFESDLSVSAWLALDVSPSMFWGTPGAARVDFAMNTAYSLASMLTKLSQPCGLTLFDTEVRHIVPIGTGKAQLSRLSNALLEISSLVHEGRTELSDRELVAKAARWFRAQEGLDVQLKGAFYGDVSNLDLARLGSAARRKVFEFIEREHGGRPTIEPSGYARESNQSLFRAFARFAGIELPLESTTVLGGQSYGLASTLEGVLHQPGGPHTIVVISDLHTADELEPIRMAALALRRRRHKVVIFCPSDPGFDGSEPPESMLHAALSHSTAIATHQRLRRARAALHPAGVSFLHCGPEDVLGRLLERLRRAA